MGLMLLTGKTVDGSLSASGIISAADGIIGPVTIPGPAGGTAVLSWSWSQAGGPSVLTLERSIDGGTTYTSFLKSDGSINGGTLYPEGDLVVKSGHKYRLKVPTADFVATTVITGRLG